MTTTWRTEITAEMNKRKDVWSHSTICTLDDEGLDETFDDGYGGINGKAFTLWTDRFVYFPVCYDGSEWCGSVPRNPGYPDGTPNEHVGDG